MKTMNVDHGPMAKEDTAALQAINLDDFIERIAERLATQIRTDQERLIDRKELANRLDTSQRSIDQMLARKEVPEPLLRTAGNGCVRWDWPQVLLYLKARQGKHKPRRGRGIRPQERGGA